MKKTAEHKLKVMTWWWCKWNRKECTAEDFVTAFENVYHKEVLEAWNDPLTKLMV